MNLFDVYPLYDINIVKGQGCKVWDENGTEYLDLYGGHAVISIGHAHPHYVEMISNQVATLGFYSNSVINKLQQQVAERLGKISGYEDYSLFLINSGAEANENALKLASFYNGRTKVISFSKAFHGRTSLAVEATNNPTIIAPINNNGHVTYLPLNDIEAMKQELAKGATKQFFVLHTYGSHFNYRERYPSEDAFFLPDYPVEAEVKYRDNLVNAYDNTIRYTDSFLSRLIQMLEEQHVDAAMLYTSDHGEDIFDDSRHLFLHASPVPSYYQLHVPFLIWMSDTYREAYPEHWQTVTKNKDKDLSSSRSFFPTMLELGGVQTSYRNDSSSVVSPLYTMKPRVYLNDHNEPRPLDDLGMKQPDFQKCQVLGIRY